MITHQQPSHPTNGMPSPSKQLARPTLVHPCRQPQVNQWQVMQANACSPAAYCSWLMIWLLWLSDFFWLKLWLWLWLWHELYNIITLTIHNTVHCHNLIIIIIDHYHWPLESVIVYGPVRPFGCGPSENQLLSSASATNFKPAQDLGTQRWPRRTASWCSSVSK